MDKTEDESGERHAMCPLPCRSKASKHRIYLPPVNSLIFSHFDSCVYCIGSRILPSFPDLPLPLRSGVVWCSRRDHHDWRLPTIPRDKGYGLVPDVDIDIGIESHACMHAASRFMVLLKTLFRKDARLLRRGQVEVLTALARRMVRLSPASSGYGCGSRALAAARLRGMVHVGPRA